MKYKVAILPPSAKRMAKNRKLVVYSSSGGTENRPIICPLKENEMELEFNLPDEYEYKYNTSIIDGAIFEVIVEYSNDTGTRTQKISLVPQKVL